MARFAVDRLTDTYAGALRVADDRVRALRNAWIEPVHLLAGLISVDSAATQSLLSTASKAPSPEELARFVEAQSSPGDVEWDPPRPVGPEDPLVRPRFVGFSPAARLVLEASVDTADRFRHDRVDTAHLIVALLDHSEGLGADDPAGRVLKALDVDRNLLTEALFHDVRGDTDEQP